jgi:ATP-binding cassette subfamily C protein LapB
MANSLFETLELFTKLYHKHHSLESLISNLPIKRGQKEPYLFSSTIFSDNFAKASKRAGLNSKIVKQSIDDIDELTLPLILIKSDGSGVILDSFSKDRTEAKVLFASSGDNIYEVSLDELKKDYSNHLIFISKRFEYHNKKSRTVSSQKHWFWDSLKLSSGIYIDVIKASLIINLFVLSVPLFSMNVYDRVIPNSAIETLWTLAVGVAIVLFFDAILKFMRTYFIEIASKKSDILISSKLFEHVMGLRSESSPSSVGSFATHFKEFDTIRNFLTSSVLTVVVDLPFLAIFLAVIFYIGGVIVAVPATIILTI